MSSTRSPISSGPTNAGTHNSSMSQRSWRHCLYFQMIRARRVGEIECQCHLPRFGISKRMELRGQLAVNQNGVWKAIWLIWGKKRCATRKRGVPDAECRVGQGSADGDGGARIEIEGHKSGPKSADKVQGAPILAKELRWGLRSACPAEQPIHVAQRQTRREVKSLECNWRQDWGAPSLEEECRQRRWYGAVNETSKWQSILRSGDGDWGAPIIAEEHHLGGGGGMKQPTMCNWWVQWLLQ